jgi:hypothetical protein
MKKITSFVIVVTLTLSVMLASTAISAGLLTAFAQSNQTRATSSSSVAASLSGSPPRAPKIKITSPIRDQQLPVGKDFTVYGTSMDNATSNDCKVSVIVNKVRPYQPATAIGPGGATDYSKWKFDITSKYTVIKPGENRITSKYECATNPNVNSFSSVNVTGISSKAANTATTTAASPSSSSNQSSLSSSSQPSPGTNSTAGTNATAASPSSLTTNQTNPSSPPSPSSSATGADQTAAKQQQHQPANNNTGGSSNSTGPLANIPLIGKLFGGK